MTQLSIDAINDNTSMIDIELFGVGNLCKKDSKWGYYETGL